MTVIEEKNVRLRLSITDTPGFGDQVNNEDCWLPIYDHINRHFDDYLKVRGIRVVCAGLE